MDVQLPIKIQTLKKFTFVKKNLTIKKKSNSDFHEELQEL
jgi:hypothetical protein